MPDRSQDPPTPSRRLGPWAGRLLLVTGSLFVTLAALEAGLRLAGYQAIFEVYSKPSIFWQHDDLLGWSHEPGAQGTYVGPRPWPIEFRTPISINSLGLRGPEPDPFPDGGYRILVLGDSLVAAFEVKYQDTFVARLQKKLDARFEFPVQTVNAGVRGYGTDQSYLWYRERGRSLAPDMVLFLHSFNDPENNITLHRLRRPFGKGALAPGPDGALELRGYPIPRYPLCSAWSLDAEFEPLQTDSATVRGFCWLQTRLSDHSALFTWVTLRIRRDPELLRRLYGVGSTSASRAARSSSRLAGFGSGALGLIPAAAPAPHRLTDRWILTRQILLALHRQVIHDGAEFVIVLPREHWKKMGPEKLGATGIKANFVEMRGPLGGALADRYIRFHNDDHLNETGHEILADLLEDIIEPIVAAQE